MSSNSEITSYYLYTPNHVLPIVFAVLVGVSLLLHVYQNFRYRFWRVTFFMFYGGTVFTSGWIMRCISSYLPANLGAYSAQYVLILCGPPIYSAAEYNVLGRLMHYLPMHSPLHPGRLVYFFIYLGIAVESLTAAGSARMSTARDNVSLIRSGSTLVAIAVVLQAVVQILFVTMVALLHCRCSKANMLTPNVRSIFVMLYGTSTLVILRCVFRAIEKFSLLSIFDSGTCDGICRSTLLYEWYLYAFEAAPMVLYTYWLNFMHPGRLLPHERNRYLDFNKVERLGPGWIDRRSWLVTFLDPFDLEGILKGKPAHEKFWERPDEWPVLVDRGNEGEGTVFNLASVTKGAKKGEQSEQSERGTR